jgi:hypothetical protein
MTHIVSPSDVVKVVVYRHISEHLRSIDSSVSDPDLGKEIRISAIWFPDSGMADRPTDRLHALLITLPDTIYREVN